MAPLSIQLHLVGNKLQLEPYPTSLRRGLMLQLIYVFYNYFTVVLQSIYLYFTVALLFDNRVYCHSAIIFRCLLYNYLDRTGQAGHGLRLVYSDFTHCFDYFTVGLNLHVFYSHFIVC